MSKKEVTEKVTKKQDKTEKKVVRKETTKDSKKEVKQPTESFFNGVKKEMKKVRWPLKQEMIKYSIATLVFIVFFGFFFYFGDLIIAAVKTLVA